MMESPQEQLRKLVTGAWRSRRNAAVAVTFVPALSALVALSLILAGPFRAFMASAGRVPPARAQVAQRSESALLLAEEKKPSLEPEEQAAEEAEPTVGQSSQPKSLASRNRSARRVVRNSGKAASSSKSGDKEASGSEPSSSPQEDPPSTGPTGGDDDREADWPEAEDIGREREVHAPPIGGPGWGVPESREGWMGR